MRKLIALIIAVVMLSGAGLAAVSFADSGKGTNPESTKALAGANQKADDNGGKEDPKAKAFAAALEKYQKLQQEVQGVQQKALESQEVQKAMKSFEDVLLQRMKSIDKGVEKKLDELKALAGEIQTMQFGNAQ